MTGEAADSFWLPLKSGQRLCRLINILRPGSVRVVHEKKLPLLERENVKNFLDAAASLGVPRGSLFTVNDLYEKQDLGAVLNCLVALSRVVVDRHGWRGASLPQKGETGFVLPVPELVRRPPPPPPTSSHPL